ncbi:MAG: ABC transporter substrate-binding protein [Acidobacteria bacterium]|nr:MAG: ABC transporter substrate-binding protein [Acidobacteriota bacterium]
MDRRAFLKSTATATAAGAGLLAGCAGPQEAGAPAVHARPRLRWRLASSFPPGLDTIFGAAEVLAERVAAMSEGRFTIRVYPAGELVPGLQVMDGVQQGTVQVGQTASYYYVGKNPALAFDACVPFGLTSRQQTAWLTEGGGLEQMRSLFADFGIINFPAGNTGAQMGGWFKREVRSAADLRGLKMRIPGLGGEVMSRLGVTVQLLAGGEIYPALERGAIDATEWVGPYDDEKLGFHHVARYYYYPGWWEPGPSLSYHVNRNAWDRLPAVYREIFTSAASESATAMQARYDARNPPALRRLLAAGVDVRPFSDDLLRAAQEVAIDMLEQQASADATYRTIYRSWRQVREDAYRWSGTAELAYARFAFAPS